MHHRLLIVGAGGLGREVYDWACDAIKDGAPWTVAGFLDDNPRALEGHDFPLEIVGGISTHKPLAEERFVCAIGEPVPKLKVARSLQSRGAEFVNLIHPTARIGRRNRLGVGVLMCPGAIVTTNVVMGDFVVMNLHSTIGHDAVVGDGCTLNCHSDVTGGAQLGEGVFLGSHASVLPGARVGDYARIGAGSTVIRAAKAGSTVVGVPGTRLKLMKATASAGSETGAAVHHVTHASRDQNQQVCLG